jgi:hypothetical protein
MPDAEVGLIISAKDKASAVLQQIGGTGKKSLGQLAISGTRAGQVLKTLPEQFAKSSSALLLFQNSVSGMGGQVADAANKLTAVVGLVATGGPIGIGLGALTLGIGAASAAWDVFTSETRNAESAQRTIATALATSSDRLREQKDEVKNLNNELRFFGQEAAIVAITKQEELIAANERGVEAITAERDALLMNGRVFRDLTPEQEKRLENLNKIIDNSTKMLGVRRQTLEQMKAIRARTEEQNSADEKQQRIAATAITQRNDLLASLRSESIAREQATKSGVNMSQATLQIAGDVELLVKKLQNKAKLTAREIEQARTLISLSRQAREEDQITHDQKLVNLNSRLAAIDSEVAKNAAARDRQLELDEQIIKSREAATERATEDLTSSMQTMANSSIDIITNFEETAENKLKAFGKLAIQTGAQVALKIIGQRAAEAAAGAASSQAGVPIIGPALATAAAGAMLAFVMALTNKFQFGGVVRGGIPNKDSVPALLTPGERVLTQRERAEYEGRPQAAAPMQNITINAQIQNPEEMTDAQIKRWLLKVNKQAEELTRDGLFLTGLARA